MATVVVMAKMVMMMMMTMMGGERRAAGGETRGAVSSKRGPNTTGWLGIKIPAKNEPQHFLLQNFLLLERTVYGAREHLDELFRGRKKDACKLVLLSCLGSF